MKSILIVMLLLTACTAKNEPTKYTVEGIEIDLPIADGAPGINGARGADGIMCDTPIFENGKLVGCMEVVSIESEGFMGLWTTRTVKETRF